LTSFEVL